MHYLPRCWKGLMQIFRRYAVMTLWLRIIGMIAILGLTLSSAVARDTYTLAVVPQYTPITVHRNWQPFIQALGDEVGITIKLRVYNSFNRFISALDRGDVDFAYLAPYHLVMARRTQPYVPLLRDGSKSLIGLVVVRKDSPYKTIQDLNGKQIDFPSPNAFAASLYLRAHLRESLQIDYSPRYVGNHDNVYRHVVRGLAAGGGGVNNSLLQQPLALQQQLRVLYEVPGVASHPIAVHERVPVDVRETITRVIMEWQTNPERQPLLKAVQLEKPVLANYTYDYQKLEGMGLDKYLVEPGK